MTRVACVLGFWAVATAAHAASVYRCVDAHGRLAFQDTPCAEQAQQRKIDVQPLPTIGDPAEVAAQRRATATSIRASLRKVHGARRMRSSSPRAREETEMSWECSAADGEVFYRHAHCPSSIPGDGTVRTAYAEKMTRQNTSRNHNAWTRVRVHGVKIPRAEACRRIHSAGAGGRDGHLRDDRVSTYDHLMGRDPCNR